MDYRRLESSCLEALAIAQSLAVRRGHAEVGPEHLLLAMLRQGEGLARPLLTHLDASPEELCSALESLLERIAPSYSRTTRLAKDLESVLDAAEKRADARGSGGVAPQHLLAGILEHGGTSGDLLRARGLLSGLIFDALPPGTNESAPVPRPVPSPSPIQDLTAQARQAKLHAILGRVEVTTRLMEILVRQLHDPVLLGEEGVGKRAVIEGLAQALTRSDTPENLRGARLFVVGSEVAADGLDELFEKWASSGSRSLFYIRDPRILAHAATFLRTFPDRNNVTLIGQATADEYYGYLSRQPYLEARFETVVVEPLSAATTVLVLRGLKAHFEARHDVFIENDALEAAADLARRHLPATKLPGAAIRVLDEAAARKRQRAQRPPGDLERTEAQMFALQCQPGRSARAEAELSEIRTAAGWLRTRWEQEKEAQARVLALRKQLAERPADASLRRRLREAESALPDGTARLIDRIVTRADVTLVVERRSDARLSGLVLESRSELLGLERNLGRDVLGQRAAARLIASSLMKASERLEVSRGPGGSFLFVGPPGVGKSEMARSLARHFLHDENAFVRVSSDDASRILDVVARRPRVLVLVRDIGRAATGVHRLLADVLEQGAASDRQGRPVDFRQALLVLSTREPTVSRLYPRLDGVIDFGCLNRDIARLITDRRCRELSERLAERRIELEWSATAVEWLAARGFPREEGAHRLHRILADGVGACLGRMLVMGELSEGSHARVEVRENRLDISPLPSFEKTENRAARCAT